MCPSTGAGRIKASREGLPSRNCARKWGLHGEGAKRAVFWDDRGCPRYRWPGGAAQPRHFRLSAGRLFGLWIEQAALDEEAIDGSDGQLEVLVADVEIEKAVIRAFEIKEFAEGPAPAEAAAELVHLIERCDAVGLPMEHQDRRQLAADEGGGAQTLGGLRVREFVAERGFRAAYPRQPAACVTGNADYPINTKF